MAQEGVMFMSGAAMAICASHSPLIDTVDGGDGGRLFLDAIDDVRARIAEFAPDLVVFFGPDHSRALENLVPAFTVVTSAQGYGDWGTPTDEYDVAEASAGELAVSLIERGFDVALGSEISLDHGFGQTFVQLFDALGAIPVVPIVVNCARAPQPRIQRVIEFGRAVGEHFRGTGLKVLFVGSGGLSHTPPSMSAEARKLPEEEREAIARATVAKAAESVNPEWDTGFLRQLSQSDWEALSRIDDDELDAVGSGTHEIRTWLATWAAAGADEGVSTYATVREWITGMGVIRSEPVFA
jgi:2,3-dihydroxyphenylpropionate 1,2-dioxygenase